MSTDETIAADVAAIEAARLADADPFAAARLGPTLVARGRELVAALAANPTDPHLAELAGAVAEHEQTSSVRRITEARRFRETRAANPFAAAAAAHRAGYPLHLFNEPDDDGPQAA